LAKDKKRKATKDTGPRKKKHGCEDGNHTADTKKTLPLKKNNKRPSSSPDIFSAKHKKKKTLKKPTSKAPCLSKTPYPRDAYGLRLTGHVRTTFFL
jgi:hypothetical protein